MSGRFDLAMFDLVVFDLGGVLIQTSRTWMESAERAGLPYPAERLEAFQARLETMPRRDLGAIESDQFYERFAELSEGVYTASDVKRISDASLIREYPGVGAVFDALG